MPNSPTLSALALRVDELLLPPANMAAARRLAEACLADPVHGHVDAFAFPTDPGNPYACVPESVEQEMGVEDLPLLTQGQITLLLAALHAIYCPGFETIIACPADSVVIEVIDENLKVTGDYGRFVRWKAIRDQVRNLGEHALHWFTLLLRRFERILSLEPKSSPAVEVTESAQPAAPDPQQNGPGDGSALDPEAIAIALLFTRPDLSLAAIANEVGVERKTVYKWPKFLDAAEKTGKYVPKSKHTGNLPHGSKATDGTMEAWRDSKAEDD